MSALASVKVNSWYRISLPASAREQLKINRGDRLLVDVQDGLLILLPLPQDHTARLAGLHKEVWEGIDSTVYLPKERAALKDLESE